MVGGQMDPQRIPSDYWWRRLRSAKAMGINTIFSYTFWNELEPEKGKWSTLPANNITQFVQVAHEQGLYVALRPGPYVGGGRDWGGFPYWLSKGGRTKVRSYNIPFLSATKDYLSRLASDLSHLQITRGGNILMVQVENEYGSYGEDMRYKLALRNLTSHFFDVPLYTMDRGEEGLLRDGYIPGVLSVASGGPNGFTIRDKVITDPYSLGPHIDGEAHIANPDHWGPQSKHHSLNQNLVKTYIHNISTTLSANNSINVYMLHGGTNFGFSTGALSGNTTFTTSYYHAAPINEAGRTTALYHTLRGEILKHIPNRTAVPEPPANIPLMALPDVVLKPFTTIRGAITRTITSPEPIYMERLSQAYGFILYEHKVKTATNGTLRAGDRPRDRIIVYVNEHQKGVIDNFYANPATITLSLKQGNTLQLLVENTGRTNYWDKKSNTPNGLLDPHKGIQGVVSAGDSVLREWKISLAPCKKRPVLWGRIKGGIQKGAMPVFYKGKFLVPTVNKNESWSKLDTYLTIAGGTRGVVWVNSFNLGRYWIVGPQQSLYLPGAILKPGVNNTVTVLELKPWNVTMVASGETTRRWENHPDPDAPKSPGQ